MDKLTLTNSPLELRLVIDNMLSLVAYVDRNEHYRLINKAYERFFNLKESNLVGKHIINGIGKHVYGLIHQYIKEALRGKVSSYNKVIKNSDGSSRYLSAKLIPYYEKDNEQNGFLVIVDDMTEQQKLHAELERVNKTLEQKVEERTKQLETEKNRAQQLASQDFLTGIYNRRSFFEKGLAEYKKCTRAQRKLCIVMLDIDHFKKINDTYGHSFGDKVLKSLTETISNSLRPDDIFGRIGGEEFSILIPNADLQKSENIMNRLKEEIANLKIDKQQLTLTCSFGVAEIKLKDETLELAMSRADQALYKAKNQGRNQVVTA